MQHDDRTSIPPPARHDAFYCFSETRCTVKQPSFSVEPHWERIPSKTKDLATVGRTSSDQIFTQQAAFRIRARLAYLRRAGGNILACAGAWFCCAYGDEAVQRAAARLLPTARHQKYKATRLRSS